MTVNFQPKKVQIQAYQHFVEKYHNKKLLVLELGIGARNQLIKAPLMRLVDQDRRPFTLHSTRGNFIFPEEFSTNPWEWTATWERLYRRLLNSCKD